MPIEPHTSFEGPQIAGEDSYLKIAVRGNRIPEKPIQEEVAL